MKRLKTHFWPVVAGLAIAVLAGGGPALAAHPDIPLYTYEEVADQFSQPMMPVMINTTTMKGMPYSPKQTCGNCHNGNADLLRLDGTGAITDASGNPISQPLVSYDDMAQQAFHAELGAEEWQDLDETQTTQAGKPWSQTSGMFGKW